MGLGWNRDCTEGGARKAIVQADGPEDWEQAEDAIHWIEGILFPDGFGFLT